MVAPMCVPCPYGSSLSAGAAPDARFDGPPTKSFGIHHAAGERAVAGPDARVDERDADARAGESRQALEPGLHLVGAGRGVRDRHERGDLDVAREVIDVGASASMPAALA